MKKILTFVSIILFLPLCTSSLIASATEHSFADDGTTPSWEWARDSIYQAYEDGIIEGKENNIFDAEGMITRAEAATMLVKWKGINPDEYSITCEAFIDVSSDKWYAKFVNAAYENDLVAGKGDGIFDPEGYMTRAEAATLVVTGCGWIPDAPVSEFKDVPESWYTPYINTAYAHDIISGMGNGICKPLEEVTRAQFVVMLGNIWMTAEESKHLYMKHFYDENNNLQETVYYHADDDTSYLHQKYTYDSEGLLLQMTKSSEDGILDSSIIYAYNEDGKLTSERTKTAAGKYYISAEYTYDTLGNLTTKKEAYSWGDYTVYSYDSNGQKQQCQEYNEQGVLEETLQYIYSEDHSEVTTLKLSDDTSNAIIVSKSFFNDVGKLLEEEYYDENGAKIRIWRYTYDKLGNLIQLASYDGRGKVTWENHCTVYEYDQSGRCIKETLYSEDLPAPT